MIYIKKIHSIIIHFKATRGLCTRHFTVGGGTVRLSPYLTNFSREEVIYLNPKPRQIIITRPRRAQKHKVPQPNLPPKLLLLPSQNLRGRSPCRYFFNFNFIFNDLLYIFICISISFALFYL